MMGGKKRLGKARKLLGVKKLRAQFRHSSASRIATNGRGIMVQVVRILKIIFICELELA